MEVYIVLTDTGTLLTKMIKQVTKQPLNHASIAFTKELDTAVSFGRKSVNNPFIGGFVREEMKGKLFNKATCAIYSCSVSEFEFEQMQQFVQQIEQQQQNYKYNFIGLFGVLLNKKINRKRAFFCSEFVTTVLNNGGISIKNKPACLVKPGDFMDCHDFRLVYQGQLSSYISIHDHSREIARESEKDRRFLQFDLFKLTKYLV
ncbi:hypothetical protein ACWM35_15025 [Neobacillus sp. K501]